MLFELIAKVQPDLPGWCSPEKAEALAAMVVALRPEITVEIGVFGGSSFIPLALAHKHLGHGKAIGIDPWSPQASAAGQTGENLAWWSKLDHEDIYRGFRRNLVQLDLDGCTQIIRAPSDEIAPAFNIGLLHVDGNHSDQAIRDVDRFANRVTPGGICVLDDLNWDGGGVVRAEQHLLSLGFRKLYPLGTGAVYIRA